MTNDIYAQMREAALTALRAAVGDIPDDVAVRVEVTRARDASHGDMSTNAALVAAKAARQVTGKTCSRDHRTSAAGDRYRTRWRRRTGIHQPEPASNGIPFGDP